MVKTVVVNTSRPYSVHIGHGLLKQGQVEAPSSTAVIVTNPRVAELYLKPLTLSLAGAGSIVEHLLVEEGESHKTLETASHIYDRLAEAKRDKDTVLVALGGGVVGDLTGFVAATYMRGVRYIQVPTTLLAQVDASIGGKTGVDHPLAKNLIGAFHQPTAVYCDVETLDTLPDEIFIAGLAEVLKTAMIGEETLLKMLEERHSEILARQPSALQDAVHRCVQVKAGLVEIDERDTGKRMLLNLGHTFGHALESASQFEISHGQAVSVGISMATQFADAGYRRRITALQNALKLPTTVSATGILVNPDTMLERMLLDKKKTGGEPRFVIPLTEGRIAIKTLPASKVRDLVMRYTSEQRIKQLPAKEGSL